MPKTARPAGLLRQLHDEESARGDATGEGIAGEQGGGMRGIIGRQGEGRVGKDEIERRGLGARDEGGDILQAHGAGEAGVGEVAADDVGGFAVLINKDARGGAAAEGLDADGAAAGEKIEGARAVDNISEAREDGAPDAVHHGTRDAARAVEAQAARGSGDDAHGVRERR